MCVICGFIYDESARTELPKIFEEFEVNNHRQQRLPQHQTNTRQFF